MSGNYRKALWLAVGIISCTALGHAQDVIKAVPEHYKVRVENEHVRVIESTLGPGEKEAMHTHPAGWYYVTKPGTMKVSHADGKVQMWEAKEGEAGWMEAEGPHTSENVGKTTMGYILVEVKSAASPGKYDSSLTPDDKNSKSGGSIR